ncbi:MAG: AAA family ATPase [Defluviitaleaceae bacterium]|nr:AAA family ATPase [Defluviitaleaceae bacterium]
MKHGLQLDSLAGQAYIVAINEARLGSHALVLPEHFLYAMLMFDYGRYLVRGAGGTVNKISNDLDGFFGGLKVLAHPSEAPKESIEFLELMDLAIRNAEAFSKQEVGLEDVLLAILAIGDNYSYHTLSKNGAELMTFMKFMNSDEEQKNRMAGDDEKTSEKFASGFCDCEECAEMAEDVQKNQKEVIDYLERFAVNMVEEAKAGAYDPLVGRASELDDIILLLCRRVKNNPVLVGDSGVGKTAIIEGLAARIAAGDVPQAIKNSNIYHMDMSALLAGTKYRGDFEDRLLNILKAAEAEQNAIICIDDIHAAVGAGATSSGALDAAGIIKPFLTRSSLRFIGTTTFEDYKKYFEKNASLTRRFHKVDILEPSAQEAIEIVTGSIQKFEEYHDVKYTKNAIEAAVNLTKKYIHNMRLPDKALDVIDHSGAYVANCEQEQYVGTTDIERAVAKMAKIPENNISADERESLATLKEKLSKEIFDQDTAIDSVVSAIKAARLGLNNPEKPVASLLFVGPTGVGKTEIARTLAATLNIELHRFDMSEYGEQHSVARLIGSPPGYIGHSEGGLLTDAVRKTPNAVLLLDEIEKAHPSILNMMLQVMDYGRLTDTQGKNADFRNIILIMTSNAGAKDLGRKMIGFDDKADPTVIQAQVNKTFAPEFRNRLNKIIQFNPISKQMAHKVAQKALDVFAARLSEKGVTIHATGEALSHIAKKGFSTEYGAREIIRVVEGEIKDQIVDAMLLGNNSPKHINLILENNTIKAVSSKAHKAKPIKENA